MTLPDLIDDLLNKYPAAGNLLYILGILLIIAIVTIIIIFIISFVTEKPFPIWSKGSNNGESKGRPTPINTSLTVKELPKNPKQLEKILNKVNDTTFSLETAEYRKQYDTLISLLSDAHTYNNIILNELLNVKISPYEVWVNAEKSNSEIYRNAVGQIEFSLHAISEITVHTEKTSIRRASITLISEDDFLHMVSSNVHPLTQRPSKIFKVGNTSECGIAGYVAYTGKARRVGDVSKDQYYKKFPTTPEYASLLTVPLMINERVLGTFSIDSTAKNAYTDIDEKRVELFSNSIVTTIITLMVDELRKSPNSSL